MAFKHSALKSVIILGGLILAGGAVLHAPRAEARVFVGVGIGAPYYYGPGPFYYGSPYYYGPPAVVYAPPPVVYDAAPRISYAAPPPQFWYYCDNPKGYYPSVSACPAGWRQVEPPAPENHN
jgi:hypothetical protein